MKLKINPNTKTVHEESESV